MRESFVFYRSFFEALLGMSNDNQGDCLMALADYALNGEEPTNMTPEVRIFFTLVKPQIDANNQRFENGRKGGRPKKVIENQKITEEKPKNNQNKTEVEPNVNVNDNVNVNVNDNVIISSDKSSEINLNNRAKEKKYAFEGKVIKLNQKDFDNWQKAYPDLNLYGELLRRDEWLAEQPPNIQKQWYMSTGQFFLKQNEFRKRQNAELDEKMGETKSGSVFDEHEVEHNLDWI